MIKRFEKFSQTEEKVLGVDLDGVLNNFVEAFNIIYQEHFPDKYVIPTSQIDHFDWYYKLDFDGADPGKWMIDHKYETWYVSKPYPGTLETMDMIYEYTQKEGIMLRIVTSQITEEAKDEAVKWITKYGIQYDDIVFTDRSADKWDHAHVLLDDSPNVIKSKPSDRVVIKMNQDWNIGVRADFNINSIREFTPYIVRKAFEKLKEL
jgi:hypothetical protein